MSVWFMRGLAVAAVVVVLDQATKLWMNSHLEFQQPYSLLPFLDLTLTYNPGAAFSFLSQASGWQRWFFTGLALAVSIFIMVWLRRLQSDQRWLALSLALVLGGAIGNVIDRIAYGYVIDFIDVYYQDWHWPAFNVADSAISIGAVLLLLESLRGERRPRS